MAAKSASTSRSDWTTRIEKPHIGRSGVPFMNSMTRFPEIARVERLRDFLLADDRCFHHCSSPPVTTVLIERAWILPSSSQSCTAA